MSNYDRYAEFGLAKIGTTIDSLGYYYTPRFYLRDLGNVSRVSRYRSFDISRPVII